MVRGKTSLVAMGNCRFEYYGGVDLAFTIPGKPQPKQRARKGRYGWYTPQQTRVYEKRAGICALKAKVELAMRGQLWPVKTKGVAYRVTVTMFFPDKRGYDVDNVLKSILDGCTPLWWNDRQVEESAVTKRYDKQNPRCEVLVSVIKPA